MVSIIGYILEHIMSDFSFTCIGICGKIEKTKLLFCIAAQMELLRVNGQVGINMNIVKFLETMREDIERCKWELEKLRNLKYLFQ